MRLTSVAGHIPMHHKDFVVQQCSENKAVDTYFNAAVATFDASIAQVGECSFYIAVGKKIVCLRFAGSALFESLTRAFAHRRVPATKIPDLTVLCWDSSSTRTTMPVPPWPATAYGAKGHIIGYNSQRYHVAYQPGVDILTMLDHSTETAIYWVEDAQTIPYWEKSFPMRGLFHWWFRDTDFQPIHAGAVGIESGGVLLTGKSGSGKSTASLACLSSALHYAGDDYVLTDCDSHPYVHSLYSTAKLCPDNLSRFEQLRPYINNSNALEQEKALLYVNEIVPDRMIAGFPIKAIFLPRYTGGGETTIRSATAVEAMFALAPTTIMHLEGHSRCAFNKIKKLAHTVPAYWLETGRDLEQIPERILEYLHG